MWDRWNNRAMIVFIVCAIISLFVRTDSVGDWTTFGICIGMLALLVVRSVRIVQTIRKGGYVPKEPASRIRRRERMQNGLFGLFFLCLLLLIAWRYLSKIFP